MITTGVVAVLALVIAGLAVVAWPIGTQLGSGAGGDDASSTVAVPPSPGAAGTRSGAASSGAATELAAPDSSIGGSPSDPQQVPSVPIGPGRRSLVRTGQLTVAVDEAATATRQVRTAAVAAGGLIVSEQTSERGSSLVLRVPADALDRVIDDVASLGRVTARTGQVVDSTGEVVDLDARVASQQASVARVRALLAQATSIGDIVSIESELARREADLDSLTNQLAALRDQVALSTLTVDLRSPSALPVEDDERAAGFSDGLAAGWSGLVALGTAVAAVVGFLLPFLPVLAVLAGLGWAARRIVRARRGVAAAGSGVATGSAGEA